MIGDEYLRYHGFAIAELLDNAADYGEFFTRPFGVKRISSVKNYIYSVNNNFGLYLKYSKKAHSPWRFTFTPEQLEDLKTNSNYFSSLWAVFSCSDSCVAVLTYDELSNLVDTDSQSPQWVSVKSFHNRSLRVEGSQGILDYTLSKTKPFNVLLQEILVK
jgi:hypothetical protein